jgi:tRNA (guanine37-N1)-methyltransferase
MVLIDAVVRLIPGVLGHEQSPQQDSFSPGADRLLDHPHYTRPPEWEGREVPEILMSGDHAAIDRWRREQAIERTRRHRPDLLEESAPEGRTQPDEAANIRVRPEDGPRNSDDGGDQG